MNEESSAHRVARSSRRRSWIVIGLLIGLLMPTAWGVQAAIHNNVNDVRDWLPAHFTETVSYQRFREQFGSDDFVVVSWPGCQLEDPRLSRLAAELRERSTAASTAGAAPLFTRVSTGEELVAEMTGDRIGLSRKVAIERLRGTLIGPNGRQTCAVVTLSDASRRRLRSVLTEIRLAAIAIGIPEGEAHLGGPAVVNDAIDRSSTQSLVRLAVLAGFVGLAIAWICFREVRLTLVIFIVAGYSAALSLAVVPWVGMAVNAILITMVPLVYVAAMSGAIHLSNYYREALRTGSSTDAMGSALRHAALPLTLATATTAMGLLSLWYSDLAPIRLFGVFSAVGVMIGLVMQLVALPALVDVLPGHGCARGRSSERASVPRAQVDQANSRGEGISGEPVFDLAEEGIEPLGPRTQKLVHLATRGHLVSLGLFALLMLAGVWGLTRVETSIQIMRLFSPETPVVSSYAWLEQHLCALVPLEIVLRFDSASPLDAKDQLQLVRSVQEKIAEIPGVSGSLSAASFLPRASSKEASLRAAVASVRLRRGLARLAEAGYWYEDEHEQAWRISVRVAAGEDLDYGEFQRRLQAIVEPLIVSEQGGDRPVATALFTGAVPIIYKARRGLLDGMLLGFGTDVVLVVISAWLLMRHWTSGLLLFLTSIFPLTLVFGGMGWCGWVIDIGSVMAPCVALGVTIDDAIHFVLWFGRGAARGLDRQRSIELAYAVCGRAMVQSWGVIGVGLSVFAWSDFVPTFRFGALTLALLTAALACNLVFLPALLAGPIGKWFAAAQQPSKGASPPFV